MEIADFITPFSCSSEPLLSTEMKLSPNILAYAALLACTLSCVFAITLVGKDLPPVDERARFLSSAAASPRSLAD